MSCYSCTRKYGMFCKEFGCANCGYSFCLKCLKNEIEVPRRNNQKQKVCLRCYEKLKAAAATGTSDKGAVNLKSRLEPNEIFQITDSPASLDPVLEPISLIPTGASQDNSNSEEITDNLDLEIVNRLKNLKAGDVLPDDDELRTRLSNLQGFQPKEYSKKDILLSTDERTEQEKINDLLKQFVEESDIDTKVSNQDPISEIESRLAALRGVDLNETRKEPVADLNTPSDNEDDDENVLKGIIQRYVAEAHLRPTASADEIGPSTSQAAKSEALEELPFCVICNEDAVVRCVSCGGDLFCRTCFKECHQDDEEWQNHVTKPYSKPPVFTEDHF